MVVVMVVAACVDAEGTHVEGHTPTCRIAMVVVVVVVVAQQGGVWVNSHAVFGPGAGHLLKWGCVASR
jgi:hypothetical protein